MPAVDDSAVQPHLPKNEATALPPDPSSAPSARPVSHAMDAGLALANLMSNPFLAPIIQDPQVMGSLMLSNSTSGLGKIWKDLETIGSTQFSPPLADRMQTIIKDLFKEKDPRELREYGLAEVIDSLAELASDRTIDHARALGRIQKTGPEIVFSNPVIQELYCAYRAKIALRSMEHAQPGRAFNDFRANIGNALPPTLPTLLPFDLPPRAKTVMIALSVYSSLFFDAYHASIEKPFIYMAPTPEEEPEDFTPGVELFLKLFNKLNVQQRTAKTLFDVLSKEESGDLDQETATALINEMAEQAEEIAANFNLSAFHAKFNPKYDAETIKESLELVCADLSIEAASRAEAHEYLRGVRQMIALGVGSYRHRVEMEEYKEKRAANPDFPNLEEAASRYEECLGILDAALKDESPTAAKQAAHVDSQLAADLLLDPIRMLNVAAEIARDRIQLAMGRMELEKVNLSQVVRSLPDQVIPGPNEKLTILVPEGFDVIVPEGNERRIRGAISNIVSNAFHYSDELIVTLSYDEETGEAYLSLRDKGKGLPEELKAPGEIPGTAAVYNLGLTLREKDSKDHKKGTGIGTTESLFAAMMHDGDLPVESIREPEEGHGTEFTMILPAIQMDPNAEVISLEEMKEYLRSETSNGLATAALLDEIQAEVEEVTARDMERATFVIRKEGCPLNQDYLYGDHSISLPQQLLTMENVSALHVILRDFLMPYEADRLNPAIAQVREPLVQHAALLVRAAKRFNLLTPKEREDLLQSLRGADLEKAESTSNDLANFFEHSVPEEANLARLAPHALHLAAAFQVRSLNLRDPLALTKDIIMLVQNMGEIHVSPERRQRLADERRRKFDKLCEAFEILPGTPFYKVAKGSFLEGVLVSLRRPQYPEDSSGLILYLIQHGLLPRVVSQVPDDQMAEYREIADRVLPLAAAFIGSEKFANPRTATEERLQQDIPQIAFVGLNRMRQIAEYLEDMGIEPVSTEERLERQRKTMAPWNELLRRVADMFINDTGVDIELWGLEQEEDEGIDDWTKRQDEVQASLSAIAQHSSLGTPEEAREAFLSACRLLDEYVFLGRIPRGKLNLENFEQMSAEIRAYVDAGADDDPLHPFADAVVREQAEDLAEKLDSYLEI